MLRKQYGQNMVLAVKEARRDRRPLVSLQKILSRGMAPTEYVKRPRKHFCFRSPLATGQSLPWQFTPRFLGDKEQERLQLPASPGEPRLGSLWELGEETRLGLEYGQEGGCVFSGKFWQESVVTTVGVWGEATK